MNHYLNQITQADCLGKNGMSKLPDCSIDLILADLPYGTTRNRWDCALPLPALWAQYKRLIKPKGAIVLFAQTPFDKVLGASNPKMLKYEWIWEKTSATGHLNARKAPLKAHENILVFYNQPPIYNPQKTTGHLRKRITAAASNKARSSENYGTGQSARTRDYDSTERYPRSVIRLKSDKQQSTHHSTQKPVALMEYFILTYTNPGQVVLDNCAGSFTTALACENTRRNWICMEKSRAFCAIGRKRLEENRAQLDLAPPCLLL